MSRMLYAGNSSYIHANHGCYLCGRGDQLVSTEVSIDGEGVLAICKPCIIDMARAGNIDVEPRERIHDLEVKLETAYAAGDALADQLAEAETRLERLQREWVAAVEVAQLVEQSNTATNG